MPGQVLACSVGKIVQETVLARYLLGLRSIPGLVVDLARSLGTFGGTLRREAYKVGVIVCSSNTSLPDIGILRAEGFKVPIVVIYTHFEAPRGLLNLESVSVFRHDHQDLEPPLAKIRELLA